MLNSINKPKSNIVSRRRILGNILTGAGAVLTGLSLTSLGQAATQKGRFLLGQKTEGHPGLETALQFPLLAAIQGRRSRRFGMGMSIPDGPLAYSSQKPPLPLSEMEQMILLTSVAGNTGWLNLHPFNKNYIPNIPNYAGAAGGRTFPSSAGFHTSEIFFTDDTGVYFMSTRDLHPQHELRDSEPLDLEAYLEMHKKRIRKLYDGRMVIPESPLHIEMHNPWCVNRPGTTLVIPVGDVAQHMIATYCYLVQNGACVFDDINKTPIPGLEKFAHLVDVKNPYPLSYVEQFCLTEVTVEIGTACYAGALTLQALGLGGWMFDGISPFSVLGSSGDPAVPGLGFRFDTDSRWPLPNATGLLGVFEGYCPPHYPNMKAAVEAFVKRKFGAGGPFNPQSDGPYKDNAKVRGAGKVHDAEFIECVTTMAQYVFDKFGKFPGTVPSIQVLMYLQGHHMDLDFYDKHFQAGGYLETHKRHMERWHA